MRADKGDPLIIAVLILLASLWVYKRGGQILSTLLSTLALPIYKYSILPIVIIPVIVVMAILKHRRGGRGSPSIKAALVSTNRGTFLVTPLRIEIKGSESQLDFSSLSGMLEDLGVGITLIINRWPGRTFLSWRQEGSLFVSGLMWKKLGSIEETQSMIKAAISALNSSIDGIKVEIDQKGKLDPELFSEIMSLGHEGDDLTLKVGREERGDIPVIERALADPSACP